MELNAKLDIEAIRYEMQVKQSKTNIQLLAISWVFFGATIMLHVMDICIINGYHEKNGLCNFVIRYVSLKLCGVLCIGKLCNQSYIVKL